MSDLRARILERVDQLEAFARASGAGADQWTYDEETFTVASTKWPIATGRGRGVPLNDVDGVHIATWDPQAVLTLCVGVRGLLDGHQPERGHLAAGGELSCAACAEHGATVWPCADVELVARMFGIDPDGDQS